MSAAVAEQLPHLSFESLAFGETERKSFDVLASVRMMRADIAELGYVRPETHERIRDEELSLLVEGVDRAACTEFSLRQKDGDLWYYRGGQWQSYTAMLMEGRQVAHAEAAKDYRKQFLAEDSVNDLAHGYAMRGLRPGEQHVWVSPYRDDVEARYGKEFMAKDCGRFPDRKMGFIYRAVCGEDGLVRLQSQTVDRSDLHAFAAVLDAAQANAQAGMAQLVDAYDQVLANKHGARFYAGRRGIETHENAWQSVLAQGDLIRYFLHGLEDLAGGGLYGAALEREVKRHMYGVWAAFKKRIDGTSTASAPVVSSYGNLAAPIMEQLRLQHEVQASFRQFAREGRVMGGCGGSISVVAGEDGVLSADPQGTYDSIFGKETSKPGEDEYGPLVFQCTQGHINHRSRGKLLTECQTKGCKKGSVGCK